MKRLWWIILLLFSLLPQPVQAYYGAGQVLCTPVGYFVPLFFNGDSTGFGQARDLCIRRGGGSITVGPGMEGVTLTYPKNANITVIRNFKTGWSVDPWLMGLSDSGSVAVVQSSKPNQITYYPGNRTYIQQALDLATATNRIKIRIGLGTFNLDSCLWIHGNTSLEGEGKGLTIFKRTRLTATDAATTGNLILSAKYGFHSVNNGLASGLPTDSLSNIELKNFTLDGNFSAWPSINPNTPQNYGFRIYYTDGVLVQNVEVRNTLQTGMEFNGVRNGKMIGVWTYNTGMQLQQGSSNGINFNDNSNDIRTKNALWGTKISITDAHIINFRDAGIDCSNVSDISGDNIFMHTEVDSATTNGNFGFEFEGHIVTYTMQGFHFNNITATGLRSWFFTNGVSDNTNLEDVHFSNVDCNFRNSGFYHGVGALNIRSGSRNNTFRHFSITNFRFTNINSQDNIAAGPMLYCYSDNSSAITEDIHLLNGTFECAGTTASSSNRGALIGGQLYNFTADKITLKNSLDCGFAVLANTGKVSSEIRLNDCFVDGAKSVGYTTLMSGVFGTIDGVRFLRCIAKDTNTSAAGYSCQINATDGTTRNVRVEGFRAIRTSGTNMQGLRVIQGGTGTIDSTWIINNDLAGANTPTYTEAGTLNKIFYRDEGTAHIQQGQSILWRNSNNTAWWPFIRVDSLNALNLYTQSGGTLDIHRADGTLIIRISGSTGSFNVTGGAKYQLGGFDLIYDSGNDRRVLNRNSAGNIVIRNTADNADLLKVSDDGQTIYKAFTFATLPGSPTNGTLIYCSDCTIANPTASGGTGAFVKRLNGVWVGN